MEKKKNEEDEERASRKRKRKKFRQNADPEQISLTIPKLPGEQLYLFLQIH